MVGEGYERLQNLGRCVEPQVLIRGGFGSSGVGPWMLFPPGHALHVLGRSRPVRQDFG